MRVLIFHAYLLRGTGSNVYNASLARALARLGHEVHLVCQDREGGDLAPTGGSGTVTVHNPEIGGLLPVFVHDTYEGFEVKTFPELTDAELDRYIALNVGAVRTLVDSLGGVDAALANHLIMGPVILARAGLGYALKVHGSDLSYSILPNLERFRPFAQEACDGASGILVGSGHIAERLRRAVDDPRTNAKVRLGPPGVDTGLFAPLPPAGRGARLRELAERLEEAGARHAADAARASAVGTPVSEKPDSRAGSRRTPDSGGRRSPTSPLATAWDRDFAQAATAVSWFADSPGPRIVFVGKLIVSKGVDLLLAAWPLIHAENPHARLLIVGFGGFEASLRRAWEGLERADLDPLRAVAAQGRGLEGAVAAPLPILSAFLERLPPGYAAAAGAASGSVAFAGRLEHDEVGELMPAADALVFPSTFPEAFGMVAAEAASAGVLPLSAAHSGAAEVSRELAAGLGAGERDLVSFRLDEDAVAAIGERINRWLALGPVERSAICESLRATVVRLWSWEGVARAVLAASEGSLDLLPVPVEA